MKQTPIRIDPQYAAAQPADEATAKQWLTDSARTATEHDHQAHMNLISRQVGLFGVPGFEVIGFDEWNSQCEKEFADATLSSVEYQGLKMLGRKGNRIMFRTLETVTASDGKVNENGIEVIIEQESDGVWRLIQERILSAEEVRQDRLKRSN